MIVQEYLRRLLKDKARLRKWKRIMIALSCIVVVCTVYALSLPAQTMACDKEEYLCPRDFSRGEMEEIMKIDIFF